MKYNHMVKVNGQYYPAGAEIPEPDGNAKEAQDAGEEISESGDSVSEEESQEKSPSKRGRKPAASQ